jgi:PfaB family protein
MQTPKLGKEKIAIVGMDVYFSFYKSLDAFERSIYKGKARIPNLQKNLEFSPDLDLYVTEILKKFDDVARIALEDAVIDSNINIATVVFQNSQQKLDSTVTEVNSIFQALETARELLSDRSISAVLVGGIDFKADNQAVGAIVLKRYQTAKQDRNRIYATIDAMGFGQCLTPEITYLEVLADKLLQEVAIDRAISTDFQVPFSCAISSVMNAGYFGIAAEIASFIKTILCIYYRYIPSVPQWQQPINLELWQKSPFYVATETKPWFLEAGISQRVAAINCLDSDRSYLILSEETEIQQRNHSYLAQSPSYFFPLVGENSTILLEQLQTLKQKIETVETEDLAKTARQTFTNYQRHLEATYAIVIIGKNKTELLRECDRANQGIVKALETGKDWQTPVGSYFTPNPQGKKGKVAYVYPSAYNAHLGLGKELFRLFPNLFDAPTIQSTCNRIAKLEKLLYPRSHQSFSPRELEAKERQLMDDSLAMLESETGFAGLITTILRDYFQVQPQAAFGYSLGETSMMYSQGVWSDLNQSSNLLQHSPLFKTRLANSQDAVREYWQLSEKEDRQELWSTYVVMANSELVKKQLQTENRVYLTQISTPQEVVIAGDPQSCERVIANLDCDAFRAPFNHVIHCEAMKSEYDRLIELNTLPLRTIPKIDFYSAANYQPIELTTNAIAHNITQTLTQAIDFPRLVNRVYQDDYRIFIEVGAGSNCSRWIKDILKDREHAVISLHRRGTDDFTSLTKALVKLVSHRVKLDLSLLYGQVDKKAEGRGQRAEGRRQKAKDFSLKEEERVSTISHWNQSKFLNQLDNNLLSKAHTKFIQTDKQHLNNAEKIIQNQIKILQQIIITH